MRKIKWYAWYMPLAVIAGTLYVLFDFWIGSLSPGGSFFSPPGAPGYQYIEISFFVWLFTPVLYAVFGAGGYFYGRKQSSALLAGILAAEGWAVLVTVSYVQGGEGGAHILLVLFTMLLIAPVFGGLFGSLGGSIAEAILKRRLNKTIPPT